MDYLARTREVPVNLLFLMPWLVVHQLCLIGARCPVDNAAGAWVKTLVGRLDRDAFVIGSLVVVGLLYAVLVHRVREAPRDRGIYGGMLLEGVVYGACLGLVARVLADASILGRVVPLALPDMLRDGVQGLGLALGAGIFEELVFRGVLVTLLVLFVRHGLGTDRLTAGLVAVLGAAWVFSAYHHWGAGGEPYVASVFAFRFWAGAALGAIFVTRGIGIAAFAHGFYDALLIDVG